MLGAVFLQDDSHTSTLIVSHSNFTGPSVAGPQLIIDDCVFGNSIPGGSGAIQMTNSILVMDSAHGTFGIGALFTTHLTSRIVHNTFMGGTGIGCSADFGAVTFDSNIFYNVPTVSASFGCLYQYNLSIPNVGISGTNNITGDPMFKDAANGDFHLKPGSAALDAANPADALTSHDFDGTPRPQGARSDIGAFEYVPAP
jgi:hypothetical protein